MSEEYSGAGFTVKEMLVRLETKVDVVLADHETRLRNIEADERRAEGEEQQTRKVNSKYISGAAIVIGLLNAAYQFYPHK